MFWHLNDMTMLIILVIFTECIRSLKLLDLHVPAHVPRGTKAQLSCTWALDPSEALYSVKWYKDGKEFFRHVPRNHEPRAKFKLPGVDVEEFNSQGSNITLSSTTLESSGRYRCEVSGEKPLFHTVSNHSDMRIIVFPDQGPILSGFRSRYTPGDRVEVTCTSGKSSPATHLGWYINGEPAPFTAVHSPTYQMSLGLEVTSLVLDFVVSDIDFIDNKIKIKCLATLIPFYWRSNEKSAIKQRKLVNFEPRVESTRIRKIPIINEMRMTTNSGYQPWAASIAAMRLGTLLCLTLNKIFGRH